MDKAGRLSGAKIISIANQKGGVGKTTTTVNLAACIGMRGKRVLVIDLDPQGNTTSGFGVDKKNIYKSSYDAILNKDHVQNAITDTSSQNVQVIPANISLAGAELELVDMERREARLRYAIEDYKTDYDYIFVDCPPSLGLLTLNALCASDSLLVPVQCEYYALEGLSQLMNTVRTVRKLYNPTLEIEGVLFTMFDARLNLTIQVMEEVKKYFPGKVYKTAIPRNVRLSEAPSFGQPITLYDKTSRGFESYMQMANEFLKNNKSR